jgi:hypothetical protein
MFLERRRKWDGDGGRVGRLLASSWQETPFPDHVFCRGHFDVSCASLLSQWIINFSYWAAKALSVKAEPAVTLAVLLSIYHTCQTTRLRCDC